MFASGKTAAVASAANYVEDVFSTYLYTGNSSTQTITNGIDLSTKGGLVWIKSRKQTDGTTSPIGEHGLWDTARGVGTSGSVNKALSSNSTAAQNLGWTDADYVSAFNSTGFTVANSGGTTTHRIANHAFQLYSSWTFRKQPKFFDVVTYTGTGVNTTVSHNLNATVGFMLIKCTSQPGGWVVYHRSISPAQYLLLQTTDAATAGSGVSTPAKYWNSTAPTSTVFSLGDSALTNESGQTYVAYLFAHDAGGFGLTGTDNVISCGSFNAGSGGVTVALGYEPQWVLFKETSGGNWRLLDTMRGFDLSSDDKDLIPNSSAAEGSANFASPTATGFVTGNQFTTNDTVIYIAIRRGPMKVPTSGTSVFSPVARSGTGSTSTVSNSITTDLIISMTRNTAGIDSGVWDRLRGITKYLATTGTATESTSSDSVTALNNTSYVLGADTATDRINRSGYTYANWTFSRAPSFFDEVCYTGTGGGQVVSHNLGVVPELAITKCRSTAATNWVVCSAYAGTLNLNSTSAQSGTAWSFNGTNPTSTQFTTRGASNSEVNTSGSTFCLYLFATCAGVSKVGSYTGTGTTLQVNCGFTGGARFVLIKRTDSTGAWYVWDTARGIVSGNDPYLLLNSTAAEVTNTDYVDTYSAGFEISSTAPAAINASGGTFIFLAIA